MASERDFELLDDYIGNRLSGPERELFEEKLNADPDLRRELRLQQGIVNSLRSARASQLKAMLNSIPPSSIPAGTSSVARWAGVAVVMMIGVGLYFYLRPENTTPNKVKMDTVAVVPPVVSESPAPVLENDANTESNSTVPPNVSDAPLKEEHDQKIDKADSQPATTPAKAPDLDVFDPSSESPSDANAPEVTASSIPSDAKITSDVRAEVIPDHKNYTFHYQFKDDKLILYGSFDKNLYEILEFIADNKRTIFLFYKNSYFLLNQAGEKVKPLSPVNDPVLIQKLKEHRGH